MGSEAEITWDLEDLIDLEAAGLGTEGSEPAADDPEAAVAALLDEADRRSEIFAERHEGKVGDLDGPGLREAMEALAELSELVGRALNYTHLSFAADTADPKIGALLQSGSERATQINTRLLFFELEWVAIDDARAEELLATDGLDFCRHHLRLERRYRPHLLSAPEERIISELSITGAGAWGRLFDEVTSAIRVQLPDEEEGREHDELERRGGGGRPRRRQHDDDEAGERTEEAHAVGVGRQRPARVRCRGASSAFPTPGVTQLSATPGGHRLTTT